jgi:predicted DNA-binding helix-hairpin-helix protein
LAIDETEHLFYNLDMEQVEKLKKVSQFMHLEPAEEVSPIPQRLAPCGQVVTSQEEALKNPAPMVHNAVMPGGKTIPLLKTMLTTACERNCFYCPFRAGRNYRRVNFKPEEMAETFMTLYRAGIVEGIFLSSGIIGGGVKTQDKLIDTADLLRHKHKFRGYLHLKIMPGAEKDQVFRAMQLASRLSVNLEAPNDRRLADLAPKKVFFEELLRPLQWVEEIRQTQPPQLSWRRASNVWPSTTTQFVVGAVGESDLELLSTSEYLYKRLKLARTYFMAFNPVYDTPLENTPAENPLRQNRLYQASFLFRDYGFDLEEMPFTEAGNLPLDTDPKLAWAQVALRESPVEVNRAEREELLRIPGIGPKGAAAILAARRRGKLREVHDLQAIGVQTRRLKPFVLLDGKRPSYQLPLF